MAKIQKTDISIKMRFEELERRMFLLKIEYEKYFSGIERIEPLKEREAIKRLIRDLMQEHIPNSRQKHKFTTLRARFSSLEMYWQRNLVQIERGTHPKMKFRLGLQEKRRAEAAERNKKMHARRQVLNDRQKEDLAYKSAYDKFIKARQKCGQGSDISYDAIKESLQKQVRTIKSQYRCDRVKFRVAIEGGKAKMKAIPVRDGKDEG